MSVLEKITNLSPDVKSALIGLAAFLLAKWALKKSKKSTPTLARLPIFPHKPIPVLGNGMWLFRNDSLHLLFTEWGRKYGEMYCLKVGRHNLVVVSSARVLRDLLVKRAEVTNERAYFLPIFKLLKADRGIINGRHWMVHRRAAVEGLRECGLGKKSLEKKIMEEAVFMTQTIEDLVGPESEIPIDPTVHFVNAAVNIICSVTLGKRYSYEGSDFKKMVHTLRMMFSQGGPRDIATFIPEFFIFSVFFLPLFMYGLYLWRSLHWLLNDIIEDHRRTLDADNPRDFIDHYLLQIRKNDDVHAAIADRELGSVLFDLFIAGSETSATTMRWLMLYLVHYPEVQEKCYQEIQQVVGDGRQPSYSDHNDMPYTQACIQEVLRIVTIAPFAVTHAISEEFEYEGYIFPKDTLLLPNLYGIHHDPDAFEDPDVFRPERWLNKDGSVHKDSLHYMPFGIGPRECLGKALANQELFILFTTLLQRFSIAPIDPKNLPTLVGKSGITLSPQDYKVKLIKHI